MVDLTLELRQSAVAHCTLAFKGKSITFVNGCGGMAQRLKMVVTTVRLQFSSVCFLVIKVQRFAFVVLSIDSVRKLPVRVYVCVST